MECTVVKAVQLNFDPAVACLECPIKPNQVDCVLDFVPKLVSADAIIQTIPIIMAHSFASTVSLYFNEKPRCTILNFGPIPVFPFFSEQAWARTYIGLV